MKLPRLPKGFTLIELLVVISIIALLAGFALPAIAGAIVKAQLVQAMSNEKQIHLATISMATDGSTNSDPNMGWPGDLKDATKISTTTDFVKLLVQYDYLKGGDLKVFSCAGFAAYSGSASVSGSTVTLTPSFTTGSSSASNNAFKIHCVRDTDDSSTVFLSTKNYTYNQPLPEGAQALKPFGDKGFVVFRKGGDASVLRKNQAQSINIVGTLTKGQSSEEVLDAP